jgi:hypothetical protein
MRKIDGRGRVGGAPGRWQHACAVASLLAVSAPVAQVADGAPKAPSVRLVRVAGAPNDVVQVKVVLRSRLPVGAYTFDVRFDPAAASLLGVEGGSTREFRLTPIVNATEAAQGRVRFSAFQAARLDGPVGRVHVATLLLRPHERRGRVRLRLDPVTVADTGVRVHPVQARERAIRLRRR